MATVTLKGGISLNVNDDYEEIVKEMYLKIDKTNAFIELECFYLPDVSSGYFPKRFELTTMSTNNNHGIIFNWPANIWVEKPPPRRLRR